MGRQPSFVEQFLSELDADPAVAALRRGCAEASKESEFRAARCAWTATVLRALWRTAITDGAAPARPTVDAPR